MGYQIGDKRSSHCRNSITHVIQINFGLVLWAYKSLRTITLAQLASFVGIAYSVEDLKPVYYSLGWRSHIQRDQRAMEVIVQGPRLGAKKGWREKERENMITYKMGMRRGLIRMTGHHRGKS